MIRSVTLERCRLQSRSPCFHGFWLLIFRTTRDVKSIADFYTAAEHQPDRKFIWQESEKRTHLFIALSTKQSKNYTGVNVECVEIGCLAVAEDWVRKDSISARRFYCANFLACFKTSFICFLVSTRLSKFPEISLKHLMLAQVWRSDHEFWQEIHWLDLWNIRVQKAVVFVLRQTFTTQSLVLQADFSFVLESLELVWKFVLPTIQSWAQRPGCSLVLLRVDCVHWEG